MVQKQRRSNYEIRFGKANGVNQQLKCLLIALLMMFSISQLKAELL